MDCKIVLTDQISATLVSADQALPIVKWDKEIRKASFPEKGVRFKAGCMDLSSNPKAPTRTVRNEGWNPPSWCGGRDTGRLRKIEFCWIMLEVLASKSAAAKCHRCHGTELKQLLWENHNRKDTRRYSVGEYSIFNYRQYQYQPLSSPLINSQLSSPWLLLMLSIETC